MKKLLPLSLFLILVGVLIPIEKVLSQAVLINMYLDKDGDTYWGKRTKVQLNGPRYTGLIAAGYKPFPDQNADFSLTKDCNDNNPNVWEGVRLYLDKDGDKRSIGFINDCIGATLPVGYYRAEDIIGFTDCDDNDPAVFRKERIFLDADGDKWAGNEGFVECIGTEPPVGYISVEDVLGFGDCNDNDPDVNAGCGPLPVELADLKASLQGQSVKLTWKTLTEANSDGFEIQRSADAGQWQNVGYVKGAGNSNSQISYSFTDSKPFSGVVFYRLKQLDIDGRFAYSIVVNTRITTPGVLTLSPNPAYGFVEINGLEKAQVKVLDVNGRTVLSQAVNGNTNLNVSGLRQGIYFFEITVGDKKEIRKLMKL